ncbi:exo-alpha-sialidase [Puniceibacterium sediminis]|uniref:BNR repeat-like domain-containing protein n=1 Tax=Puniceibacterium sediminis TaxID=1608407 RepID=A0A238XEZ7_9RHOB|nr:exo-alpha-sialidase [Puniceibacterium sediminis]SNR56904.1 BNR repeat-like domain-containing protein [Puniceibacterium sediminis]
MIQNHAAFLHECEDGVINCAWFGGSLEGKSDIAIRASVFLPGGGEWGAVATLSHDPDHSEQNPVLSAAPDGRLLLLHTSQPAGNQDEWRIRMAKVNRDGTKLSAEAGKYLDLSRGCFIRAPLQVLGDARWLLPIFRCVQRPSQKWTGSQNVAAIGGSKGYGNIWAYEEISGCVGSVHMCPVALDGSLAAFYRRRQADHVHRSESVDGGLIWTARAATDVPNNNSSVAAIRLASGEIAMICTL